LRALCSCNAKLHHTMRDIGSTGQLLHCKGAFQDAAYERSPHAASQWAMQRGTSTVWSQRLPHWRWPVCLQLHRQQQMGVRFSNIVRSICASMRGCIERVLLCRLQRLITLCCGRAKRTWRVYLYVGERDTTRRTPVLDERYRTCTPAQQCGFARRGTSAL